MKREYKTGLQEGVKFFRGFEVERTPMYNKTTLFVVGMQPIADIEAMVQPHHYTEHIFFGANHSFNPKYNDVAEWNYWTNTIQYFLNKDFWCSLDIPLSVVEEFNDSGLNEHDRFIPQIRVPIPYIKLWNYNNMIKIDDKGFNQTNPGVWTHSLHTLMDRSKFTDWSRYKDDEISET